MKTAIEYPQIYFTVYEKKPSPSSPSSPSFRVIGSYPDIRDAIQAIVTAYRRKPTLKYGIESSTTKPRHWLHPSKYRN
jgi:hypothetical protein